MHPLKFAFQISMFGFLILAGCQTKENTIDDRSKLTEIRDEMKILLKDKMLDAWYPTAIDSVDGGFLSVLDENWQPYGDQTKFIVTQARHVWSLARAMERYPENEQYAQWAAHGFKFLSEKMWDQEEGGFYELRLKNGDQPPGQNPDEKRAYGNSFGIYASAAYARATGSEEALEFAKETFRWMNKHSYDPIHGGYFQFLTREGRPFHEVYDSLPFYQYYKDQNSSIHIMEAFSELYRIWPNDTLRNRLEDLFLLIRDDITNPEGYMTLFFTLDWKPVSFRGEPIHYWNFDHVSFGHDIETAFLLLDASDALGRNDAETDTITKRMVDHSISMGLDRKTGGLYYKGYYFLDEMAIVDDQKSWWVEAEALNSLLLFDGLYPEEGYLEEFISMWDYSKKYLIDWERGGWYNRGYDNFPEAKNANKGAHWKSPYHTLRSIKNCIDMLDKKLGAK